jgi:hypothetical protein
MFARCRFAGHGRLVFPIVATRSAASLRYIFADARCKRNRQAKKPVDKWPAGSFHIAARAR